ncbi:MAG TPA: hypothetical protein VHD56_19390 [Tepidisphaeraceae bacterium]|nr:hypothetical protein [Tepidisphaeraceae bacterium]
MIRAIKGLKLAVAVGVLGLIPAMASAEDHGFDRRHDDRNDVRFNIGFGATEYARPAERVWVAPVYRTVCDRVWAQPVVRDECERVWVPPCYENREVVRFDGYRRRVVYEQVMVSPGHYEERHHQVVVTPGHWDNVERQELVSAGYWQECAPVRVERPSFWSFNFGFRGH